TFMLFFIVWAADSGAFVTGKLIGGPKISHALSPSKTWAGICGGVLGGCIAGAVAGVHFFGWQSAMAFLLIGGVLGAASVAGDLFESALKRNFGLKDISGFIPGHGGALDRMDGMIFATAAMTGGYFAYMLATSG
ncbi:MAG: phosphatidate cytidylyltransferase, partial [Hyphococcus sp.]